MHIIYPYFSLTFKKKLLGLRRSKGVNHVYEDHTQITCDLLNTHRSIMQKYYLQRKWSLCSLAEIAFGQQVPISLIFFIIIYFIPFHICVR